MIFSAFIFATIVSLAFSNKYKDVEGYEDYLEFKNNMTVDNIKTLDDYLDINKLNSSAQNMDVKNFNIRKDYPAGDCEVFIIEENERVYEEKLKLMNISVGDAYNMTYAMRDGVKYPIRGFNIASLELIQHAEDIYPPIKNHFHLRHTKDGIFNVTHVLPVHMVEGRSTRTLYASTSHPRFPDFRYVTDLVLRDSRGALVSLKNLYKIQLQAIYVQYNGDHIGACEEGVLLDIFLRFLKPHYYSNMTDESFFKSQKTETSHTTTEESSEYLLWLVQVEDSWNLKLNC